MRESAMVREAEDSALQIGEHIQIRGFPGQAHGDGCQSSLAIEAGASETCSGKKMGDGFQSGGRYPCSNSQYNWLKSFTGALGW